MSATILILAILGCAALAAIGWRTCVQVVLVLVVFEGAVRKWILPQASEFVYFAKDIVIIAAYVKFLISPEYQPSRLNRHPFLLFLVATCFIFCILQTCNLNLGSPIVGIVGARNYLLYLPLMLLLQTLFDSKEALFRFLRWYLPLSIPILLLAILQNASPEDSALNVYVWGGAKVGKAFIGEHVRATGTFSYLAGYSAYLQTIAALTIPLLVIELPTRWKWLFRLVLVCAMAGMLLTGSRGPVLAFGLFMGGYFIFNQTLLRLRLYGRFMTPLIVGTVALIVWFRPQLVSLSDRFVTNEDMSDRIYASVVGPVPAMQHAGLFGYGTGATYQAADIVRSIFHLPEGTPLSASYESEPERVMLELGPIGFALWYLLRITIIALLFRTFTSTRLPFFRELALTAFLVHLVSLTSQMVFQITFMVYYWFLAGFIFLLPLLDKVELEKAWEASKRK